MELERRLQPDSVVVVAVVHRLSVRQQRREPIKRRIPVQKKNLCCEIFKKNWVKNFLNSLMDKNYYSHRLQF